jgi:hypothetical protein
MNRRLGARKGRHIGASTENWRESIRYGPVVWSDGTDATVAGEEHEWTWSMGRRAGVATSARRR